MCSGRVDLAFLFQAFRNGIDGVFIGGCHFNECHYITDGNFHALNLVLLCRKLLKHMGLSPKRVRMEQISAGEGTRFSELMNEFALQLKGLGPVGSGEGLETSALHRKLDAVIKLVPYIRLVERERLHVPVKSEEASRRFYASEELDSLFDTLIADKLAMSEITFLVGEKPRSAKDLSDRLDLSPSEIARHMKATSRQGLVKYDAERGWYSLR